MTQSAKKYQFAKSWKQNFSRMAYIRNAWKSNWLKSQHREERIEVRAVSQRETSQSHLVLDL